jgi:hypothetical protein
METANTTPAPRPRLPKYLTLREVASACRCSLMTIRRRIAQKRFKGVEFCDVFGDGRLLCREDQLFDFLAKRTRATGREYDGSIYLSTMNH